MASSWTHAAAAIATVASLIPGPPPKRIWTAAALAGALPDVDAIGRPFGLGDIAWLGGHRAFTHSLIFAVGLGFALTLLLMAVNSTRPAFLRIWLALAAATMTHGLLDSMTLYGDGVEFLSPFSTQRFVAPWQILGNGILRDTFFFAGFAILAAWTIKRRDLQDRTAQDAATRALLMKAVLLPDAARRRSDGPD